MDSTSEEFSVPQPLIGLYNNKDYGRYGVNGKMPVAFIASAIGPSSAGPREYEMSKALGLKTAVTTIPGGLYRKHKDALTALPRVSLNGLFQARRYVDVFATPAVFTMMGR